MFRHVLFTTPAYQISHPGISQEVAPPLRCLLRRFIGITVSPSRICRGMAPLTAAITGLPFHNASGNHQAETFSRRRRHDNAGGTLQGNYLMVILQAIIQP